MCIWENRGGRGCKSWFALELGCSYGSAATLSQYRILISALRSQQHVLACDSERPNLLLQLCPEQEKAAKVIESMQDEFDVDAQEEEEEGVRRRMQEGYGNHLCSMR